MVSFTLARGTVLLEFEEAKGATAKNENIGDMSEMGLGKST